MASRRTRRRNKCQVSACANIDFDRSRLRRHLTASPLCPAKWLMAQVFMSICARAAARARFHFPPVPSPLFRHARLPRRHSRLLSSPLSSFAALSALPAIHACPPVRSPHCTLSPHFTPRNARRTDPTLDHCLHYALCALPAHHPRSPVVGAADRRLYSQLPTTLISSNGYTGLCRNGLRG